MARRHKKWLLGKMQSDSKGVMTNALFWSCSSLQRIKGFGKVYGIALKEIFVPTKRNSWGTQMSGKEILRG